jgi:exosortase A
LPGTLTAGVLLILVGMFWPTFYSMVEIWERSETFTHGYLIFPISAWLIWRQRAELAQVQPRPDLRGLILLAAAGAGWLLADAGSVNVVAQYAFIAMLIAMVWTLLGRAFVWAAFFPLMFLFFAVPVGEFLIQPLMGVTADFTVAMLRLTGIPVYREGLFFSIPSGDWSVVEGCSGLRYLIASVTLGVLYAYLTYRSWKRRLLFSLAAIIVPIFANSGRAYMIVMIAHLSDMKHALGVDHYIYGWVFFGIVMLLLFWIGSFWREDDQPRARRPVVAPRRQRPAAPAPAGGAARAGRHRLVAGLRHLAQQPPAARHARIAGRIGGRLAARRSLHHLGAALGRRRPPAAPVVCAGRPQRHAGTELLRHPAAGRRTHQFAEFHDPAERLAVVQRRRAHRQRRNRRPTASGAAGQAARQQRPAPAGVAVEPDQPAPMVNDHLAKLVLAFDRVQLKRDDGLSVLIATPYDETDLEAAAATLAQFAADMEPAIGRTLDQVDGP